MKRDETEPTDDLSAERRLTISPIVAWRGWVVSQRRVWETGTGEVLRGAWGVQIRPGRRTHGVATASLTQTHVSLPLHLEGRLRRRSVTAQLHRRLGLYSVFTVSIGAMIGSGIFVLPGLAFEVGGPSTILAFVLAGVIVFPAALAQSEMSTAIPRAGGAYLYVDLAMGPLMGTIAGIGVWFSLVFKSAFALDGLSLYLGLFTDLDPVIAGLAVGAVLLIVNLVGIKQSGSVQAILVTVVFVVLLLFIGGGATLVERDFYRPFLSDGFGSLLATAGIVFVSYAGVTNVASVAEEVANPARALPVAILSSLLVMIFVYPTVTYVMVGVTPPDVLAGNLTPLATASEQFFPPWAATGVAVIGVLALASMANAGLLATSRYPFAMARRRLFPQLFTGVGERSGVPAPSLILTGGVLLGLVAFVPVFELAKLASAFQLLVLALICLAQLAFRTSGLWWYRPKFTAPGYPVVPILGILACLLLITQIGLDAIIGALAIILGGLAWYLFYGRSRAIKENAFRESVRQQGMARLVQLTKDTLSGDPPRVAIISDGEGQDDTSTRIARSFADVAGTELVAPGNALLVHLERIEPDLILASLSPDGHHDRDVPEDRDAVFLSRTNLGELDRIAVLGSGGPYDVLKISLAMRLATAEGASLRFAHVLDPSATRAQVRSLEQFHSDLGELSQVETESMVLESEDLLGALTDAVGDVDLAIIGAPTGRHLGTDLVDRLVQRLAPPVLVVRAMHREEPAPLRRFFDRLTLSSLGRHDATHED